MGKSDKVNIGLPTGLNYRDRYNWLKSRGICVTCGKNKTENKIRCSSCDEKHLQRQKQNEETIRELNAMRIEAETKKSTLDECIEQADRLGMSYGQYMGALRVKNDD